MLLASPCLRICNGLGVEGRKQCFCWESPTASNPQSRKHAFSRQFFNLLIGAIEDFHQIGNL